MESGAAVMTDTKRDDGGRAFYVVVYYTTKRGAYSVGMTVDAASPADAITSAHAKHLDGYPARNWMGTEIREEPF